MLESLNIHSIRADTLRDLLSRNPKALLIDVRNPDEYISGHIPGSQLMPLSTLAFQTTGLPDDKDTPIVVYCLSGARSSVAAGQLARRGYRQVYDFGAITLWPYEIIRGR